MPPCLHTLDRENVKDRCTAALLLDVDPVGMVRGSRFRQGLLDQCVNDRPYVAASFLSVAIAQVYGTALGGRCKARPELVNVELRHARQARAGRSSPVEGQGGSTVPIVRAFSAS